MSDEQQIEAHANGMLDIQYDSISDKAKEQMDNNVLNGDKKVGNSSSETPAATGKQMIEDADKRKASKNKVLDKLAFSGSNIANITESKKPTMKKIKAKGIFLNESQVQKFLDKNLKENLKINESEFFFEDEDQNRYRFKWEGDTNGEAVLVESYNIKKRLVENKTFSTMAFFDTDKKTSVLDNPDDFQDYFNTMK
jgi:hypothetical protein